MWDVEIRAAAGGDSTLEAAIATIVAIESGGNPGAVGDGGTSFGLGQLQLPTARGLGYQGTAVGLLDPTTNLALMAALLRQLRAELGSDWPAIASGYNCGAGAGRSRCQRADGSFSNQSYVDRFLARFAPPGAVIPGPGSTGAGAAPGVSSVFGQVGFGTVLGVGLLALLTLRVALVALLGRG